MTSPEIGEQNQLQNVQLNAEQILFLFGDQGQLSDSKEAERIFDAKCDLAYEWLAQFWVDEIPEDFVAQELAARTFAQSYNDDLYAEGIDERFLLETPLKSSVVHALQLEWRGGLPIEERPILCTALLKANNALGNDQLRDEKFGYILALVKEAYDYSWVVSGNSFRPLQIPEPIHDYIGEQFPIHLIDSDLLW